MPINYDTWGGSWGSAWGNSWGRSAPEPSAVIPETTGGMTGGGRMAHRVSSSSDFRHRLEEFKKKRKIELQAAVCDDDDLIESGIL